MKHRSDIVFSLQIFLSFCCFCSSAFTPALSGGKSHGAHCASPLLDDDPDKVTKALEDDELEFVRHYTELAVENRETAAGLESLRILGDRCQNRMPYDFDKACNRDGTVVAPFPQLLSPKTRQAFLNQVREVEANGWLSTNPDSVDGLPSLHLNLVSNGKATVEIDSTGHLDDFQQGIQKLLHIVQPEIYNVLLPKVHRLLNSTSIRISDVFLRRYGHNICGDLTRNGISAHYDVFSRVTAVIALDDVAAQGTNGLFTTDLSDSKRGDLFGKTSNHAAMRRFFPLGSGDGVVHTWDVLHGVDVEPGLDRTSLIIWFTEGDNSSVTSPWLVDHPDLETDDVAQFVLASALSSVNHSELDATKAKMVLKEGLSEQQLYLRSATHGNTFALTRMGSLLEEGSLTGDEQDEALLVLERLRPSSQLPGPIRRLDQQDDEESHRIALAMRFWLEGAVRGNPLAQRALADELMLEASQSGDEDGRLLAAVLFALATQQGMDGASEALSRLVEFDLACRSIQSEEDFLTCQVVQVARAATL